MIRKKQYRTIAETIRQTVVNREDKMRLVEALCKDFKEDNPSFSAENFKQACYGYQNDKV